MKFRLLLCALLMVVFVADFADARRRRRYRGRGITVKVGTYVYTWYGPGGRAEAIRQAHRRTGGRYLPRRNTTPVQHDVKQKETLKPVVFPSVTASLAGALVYIEPSQKAAQKSVVQKSEPTQKSAVQKSSAKKHHKKRKGWFAKRRARRAAARGKS